MTNFLMDRCVIVLGHMNRTDFFVHNIPKILIGKLGIPGARSLYH